jgi:hypothetical protein
MSGRPDARRAPPRPVLPAAADDPVAISGATASLTAPVEATPILRDAPDRSVRRMTRAAADLVRDGGFWRMRRMVIAGAWPENEAGVLPAR